MTGSELAIVNHQLTSSIDCLELYLNKIRDIPILSADEEAALFKKLRQTNDVGSARILIISHLRFVVYIAKSYAHYGIPLEDLIQEGNIGLMKSVKRYDLSQGTRLITYAIYWIKAQIHEYIQKNWKIVKAVTSKAQRKLFIHLNKNLHSNKWLTQDEAMEISKALNVHTDAIFQMEAELKNSDFYLNDEASDGNTTPISSISDESWSPQILIENEMKGEKTKKLIYKALKKLHPRERHIIINRWLSPKKQKLRELACLYGISEERVRQIEKESLKKMRNYLNFNHNEYYQFLS